MHIQRIGFLVGSVFVSISLVFSVFIFAFTTAPSKAHAGGGGGFLTALLVVAAVIAIPYIAPELFSAAGGITEIGAAEAFAADAALGPGAVSWTASEIGTGAIIDSGLGFTTSFAAAGAELPIGVQASWYMNVGTAVGSGGGAVLQAVAIGAGVTDAIVSSDGSTGTAGRADIAGSTVPESELVPGNSCYSAPNACGQAYAGILAYSDDGTLTCYQSNAPTVVLSTTPPPNDTCPAPAPGGSCTWQRMAGTNFSCTTSGGYPQDVDVSAYVDESGLPWMRLVGHCYYFAGYTAFDTGYRQGTSITGSGTCPVGFQWTVAGSARLTLNAANILSANSTYGGGYPGSCSVPAPACPPAPSTPQPAATCQDSVANNTGSALPCTYSSPTWTNYCTGGSDPFGHSWQIWRYDNSTPTNYEFVGIDLTTCGPLTKIDGSCRADHWNCITGESANNTGGTSGPWTWSCEGSNGGLDVSCSQSTGRGGTGGTGGTGSTGSTGTGSCVVRGGVSQRLCSGSSLVSYNNCGTVVDSQPCPYGCSGGACRLPSPITFTPFTANSHVGTQTTFEATGNLQVRPVLVKKGEPTWLYWNVQDASSCTVNSSANAVDSWNALSSGADGRRSQPIQGHTVFTLHCTPLSGDPSLTDITETQAVDVAPIFQEL